MILRGMTINHIGITCAPACRFEHFLVKYIFNQCIIYGKCRMHSAETIENNFTVNYITWNFALHTLIIFIKLKCMTEFLLRLRPNGFISYDKLVLFLKNMNKCIIYKHTTVTGYIESVLKLVVIYSTCVMTLSIPCLYTQYIVNGGRC